MNIIVNENMYNDISWNGSGFSFSTNMTLAEIESTFIPSANSNIIIIEDGQEVGRYYNKGISSITVSGKEPRTVTVQFNLTQITPNAETEIRNSLEDSDGAIIELADIIGELSEMDISETLQSHQETLDTWFSHAGEIIQALNELRGPGGILEQFNIRISALEQGINVESAEEE